MAVVSMPVFTRAGTIATALIYCPIVAAPNSVTAEEAIRNPRAIARGGSALAFLDHTARRKLCASLDGEEMLDDRSGKA
jgi:hypothetical protein